MTDAAVHHRRAFVLDAKESSPAGRDARRIDMTSAYALVALLWCAVIILWWLALR